MLGRKIYSGSIKLATGAFASRLLGFLREILTAKFVGGGHEGDVFALAYRIPNLARQILGEKAAESAYLPVFKTLMSRGQEAQAHRVSRDTFKILLVCLGLFVGLGLLFAPSLVAVMGRGFGGTILRDGVPKFDAAVTMTRLLFPTILLVGFFAFLGARMLAYEQFGAYAAAPLIANAMAVVVILATFRKAGWYCAAWGVLAGVLAECVFFWWFSKDRETILTPPLLQVDLKNPDLRKAGGLWVPIMVGSGFEKIGTIIESLMASFLGKGAVAALYYSNLVALLAFSVLGLSFNRSVIPYLTEQSAQRNFPEFRKTVATGMRLNLLLLLPAAFFFMVLAEPLIRLFFQRDRFDAEATMRTAITLRAYAVGLVAMGWFNLLSRSFYALLDTKTPLFISMMALVVNVILNFTLWQTPLRQAGLALANSVAFWLSSLVLLLLLHRRLSKEGSPFLWRALIAEIRPVLAVAAVFGLTVAFGWPMAQTFLHGSSIFMQALRIAVVAAVACAGFLCVGRLLGIEEIGRITRKLRGLATGRA